LSKKNIFPKCEIFQNSHLFWSTDNRLDLDVEQPSLPGREAYFVREAALGTFNVLYQLPITYYYTCALTCSKPCAWKFHRPQS